MPKKLYISDLDGTLAADQDGISDYSKTTLQQLIGGGVQFTVASARGVPSIRPLLRGLELRLPVIGSDGATLSDLASGEHHVVHTIGRQVFATLYRLIKSSGLSPFVCCHEPSGDRLYHDALINEGMRWLKRDRQRCEDPRLRPGFPIADLLQRDIISVNIIGRRPDFDALLGRLGEVRQQVQMQFFDNPYSPGWFWLTFYGREAQKGKTSVLLADRLGVEPEDIVVFGDGANDLSMFSSAGRAVAVANALPEVKAAADEIIGLNTDDSVARYILRASTG